MSFAGSIAGVDRVRVTSGGQCAEGTCNRRVGTTRHDLGRAADLELLKNGRTLRFTVVSELPFFEAFVEASASLGATGIGGDVPYMGAKRIHVGFGSRATWGGVLGGGAAPNWLSSAARRGWNNPINLPTNPDSGSRFMVNARSGLRLRSGPGLDFGIIQVLTTGTIVTVQSFGGANQDWAKIDLQGDGVSDGYVFRTFLEPIGQNINFRTFTTQASIDMAGIEEDCAADNPEDDDDTSN